MAERALVALVLLGVLASAGCIDLEKTRWERSSKGCPPGMTAEPWPIASPADAGLDGRALDALADRIEAGALPGLHSLLVVREGRLVFERYFRGWDASWGRPLGTVDFGPDTLHDLRSVTKSVVGALVGIARGDGLLPDLDRPLVELLPEDLVSAPEAVAKIGLRHALTMSAGLDWDELRFPYWDPRNDEIAMWRSDDPVGFVLSRPIVAEPGARFAYNGGLPTLLAAVVEHVTGTRIDRFAAERLFCPLGTSKFEWMQHGSGLHVAASGLRLRPRDMARFGWMMLDGGRWHGREILPAEYVHASLTAQLETESPLAPAYGYQWWIARETMRDGVIEIPAANGNGGQRIYLLRDARLVVVVTAGNYDAEDQAMAPQRALRALLEAARG